MSNFGACGCRPGSAIGVQVVSLGGYRGSAFMAATVGGTAATIELRTLAAGRYRYRLWLSDSPDDPRESIPPANAGALHWDGITADDGTATIRVEYPGPKKTFYPWVELVPVSVGEGISIGEE